MIREINFGADDVMDYPVNREYIVYYDEYYLCKSLINNEIFVYGLYDNYYDYIKRFYKKRVEIADFLENKYEEYK